MATGGTTVAALRGGNVRADDEAFIRDLIHPVRAAGEDGMVRRRVTAASEQGTQQRNFRLLDAASWEPADALAFLQTGVAPNPGDEAHEALRKMFSGKEPPGRAFVSRARREKADWMLQLVDALWSYPHRLPRRPNDWIRWGVQHGITCLEFWLSYWQWRQERWHLGSRDAYLSTSDPDASGKRVTRAVSPEAFPEEALWFVSYDLERAWEKKLGRPVWFSYTAPGLSSETLVQAVANHRKTVAERQGDSLEGRSQRMIRVGAGRLGRIEQAVHKLAGQLGREPEPGGRYFFGMTRSDLIRRLKRLDTSLESIKDSIFYHALPGFVRGAAGRPPLSATGRSRSAAKARMPSCSASA